MSKFLLLLAGKFSAVKAYLKRVIADGGTTSDPAHAQVVYDNTIGDEPTLIQSCDSGKATVLYNIEPTNADFTVDRNSTKYVLGSGGTIIPSATDEPAFEFNADGSYKGLLVEPAATNVMPYSEDFSQWTPTGVTVATDTTTAPDGTTLAYAITGNAGTTAKRVREDTTIGTLTTYTFSVFAKAGTNDYIQLISNADADAVANFDLSNGTVGTSGSDTTGVITDYGNGWYRCEARFTSVTAGTPHSIYLVDSSSATYGQSAATTGSVYLWGAQVEDGPIATSYIPTTTASVTRVKDDITLGSASSLIGQTEGTLYVEVDWKATSGTSQRLLLLSDGTSNNRILIYNGSGVTLYMYADADGVSLTAQGESSTGYSGIQKIAFAYAENDFELYRNGSSISSDTSGSLSALGTLTDIDLGQGVAANLQANMHIRAVAIYPTRLSDAECEALTTL